MTEIDIQKQMFGLMTILDEQSRVAKEAIDGLATERAALAKERAAVANVANEVRRAAADAIPAMQRAAGEAVGASVRASLSGTAQTLAASFEESTRPILGRLAMAIDATSKTEATMQRAAEYLTLKLVALAAAALGAIILTSYLAIGWQQGQIIKLSEEKEQIESDIATLKVSVIELEKRGARIRLNTCGPDSRLCVEITKKQRGKEDNYEGPYSTDDGKQFVIPSGY